MVVGLPIARASHCKMTRWGVDVVLDSKNKDAQVGKTYMSLLSFLWIFGCWHIFESTGWMHIYIYKLYHRVMFHISDWHVTSCCLNKIHILWCFIIMIILFIYHTVSLSLDPAVICHGVEKTLMTQGSVEWFVWSFGWAQSLDLFFFMLVGQKVLTSLTSLYKPTDFTL